MIHTVTTQPSLGRVFTPWFRRKLEEICGFYAGGIEVKAESVYNPTNETRYMYVAFTRNLTNEKLFKIKMHESITLYLETIEEYNPKYIRELTKLLVETFHLTGLELCDKLEGAIILGEDNGREPDTQTKS